MTNLVLLRKNPNANEGESDYLVRVADQSRRERILCVLCVLCAFVSFVSFVSFVKDSVSIRERGQHDNRQLAQMARGVPDFAALQLSHQQLAGSDAARRL